MVRGCGWWIGVALVLVAGGAHAQTAPSGPQQPVIIFLPPDAPDPELKSPTPSAPAATTTPATTTAPPAGTTAPPATTVLAPPPSRDALKPVTVKVHIESPKTVVLEKQVGDGWKPVCTSPCDRELLAGGPYRINGDDVRPSGGVLIQPGQPVRLEVEPTSSAGHAAAFVVVVVGALGLAPNIGALTLDVAVVIVVFYGCLFYSAAGSNSNSTMNRCLDNTTAWLPLTWLKGGWWIPAIPGVLMIAAGGVWLGATPASSVNVIQAPDPTPPATPDFVMPPGFSRVPEWRPDPLVAAGVNATPFQRPIFRVTF